MESNILHPLWFCSISQNRIKYFFSPYSGCLSKSVITAPIDAVRGGVLADEMGLGKTLEILSLITLNQHPNRRELKNRFKLTDKTEKINVKNIKCYCKSDDFSLKCDLCHELYHIKCGMVREYEDKVLCAYCEENLIESHATLVVCPKTIIHQWIEEIHKHLIIDDLTYTIYETVTNKVISPRLLSLYDVVLISYDTLSKDIDFIDSNRNMKSMRYESKYIIPKSPLVNILWWRVCFDEAQRVEIPSSPLFKMAMNIKTVNKWCITGTPIKSKIDDLFGLLKVLEVSTFDINNIWKYAIRNKVMEGNLIGLELLQKILFKIFWRSSMTNVRDENIDLIPNQNVVVEYIEMNSIEWNVYKRQKIRCLKETETKIIHLNQLKNITSTNIQDALKPLYKLRKICCCPQLGLINRSGKSTENRKNKIGMDEILKDLLHTTRIECEEAQRLALSSYNGLAGIALLLDNLNEAIMHYESGMKMIVDNASKFRVDKLQSYHTYYHLSKLLDQKEHAKNKGGDCNLLCGLCIEEKATNIYNK